MLGRAAAAWVLLGAAAVAQDVPTTGTIVGIVTSARGGSIVAYADVAIEPSKQAFLAGSAGRFKVYVAPGQVTVRVRRMGFAPTTLAVTVVAGRADTLRIQLEPLALVLEKIRASGNVCPNRAQARVDTAIITVLQQVRLNAERSDLFAREYPFEVAMQRTVASEVDAPNIPKKYSVKVELLDTVYVSGRTARRYRPGQLIVSASESRVKGANEKLIVPQLADFADDAFQATHCFRYRGVASLDGRRLARIDFEPTRDVRGIDVNGSLYLDPTTYQLTHSVLLLERPSPQKAGDMWDVRIDTWFGEAAPSLPMVDSIFQRTTVRDAASGQRPGDKRSATEGQRRVNLRFLDRAPGTAVPDTIPYFR